jgi:hypothetical protein
MKLTSPQLSRFWREWSAIVSAKKWHKVEAELQRYALLARAGFDSLTQVDKQKGFDRVLAELSAIARPDDIEPQMRAAQMPRTRFYYAIIKLAREIEPSYIESAPLGSGYLGAIMRDKYGHYDIDRLPESELEHLRNTLQARLLAHRRQAAPAAAEAVRQDQTELSVNPF